MKPNLNMLAGAAIIALIAFLAYLPSINGRFIMDDDFLLTNNPFIKASDGLYRLWCTNKSIDYWPMTNTSFWIEWRLWEMNSTGYRVSNLILHIVESLLIWIILRRLSVPGAFLAALLFTLHPVNVESVAWITQRKNMMSMLFFLLSILWYQRFFKSASRSYSAWYPIPAGQFTAHCPPSTAHIFPCYWLSLAAFVLAMLGKGSAVVLPVLLLGLLWWLRSLTRREVLRIVPFFLLAVVLTVVNIWFQTHGTDVKIRNAGFAERLLGAGCVLWFYLYKALLPIDLAFIYSPWHFKVGDLLWWLPLLAALMVTAMLWRYRKGCSRPLLFAWGFFGVSLVPVLGFTDVGFMKYSLVADHFQHIAVIGVITLAAAGWSIWRDRARNIAHWATASAVVTAGVFTFLTYQQNKLYSDPVTLYQDTLLKNPECWIAKNNLGVELYLAGQLQAPIKYYEQALEQKPDYAPVHNNLGLALNKAGRFQEAIENYQQALSLQPQYPEALNNLGSALVNAGRPQEAIEYYERSLHLKPDYANAHINLGLALADAGRFPEAIEHFRQALRLKPDYAYVYFDLALAHAEMQQSSYAIAAAQKGMELARSKGQLDQAEQIEKWLNSYRADILRHPNDPSDPSAVFPSVPTN